MTHSGLGRIILSMDGVMEPGIELKEGAPWIFSGSMR
jgi:hypothetical protein